MLKIDEQARPKHLPQIVLAQLGYLSVYTIRENLSFLTFFMFDFFMVIPLLAPIVPIYLYILLPPLVFINLWCVSILVRNPYSVQYESTLFIAASSLFASFAFLLLVYKIAYYQMGIEDWGYYVVATVVHVLTFLWYLAYTLSQFKDLSLEGLKKLHKEEREKARAWAKGKRSEGFNVNKLAAFTLYVPTSGYMIFAAMRYSENGATIILALCFLGFGALFSCGGIKFTHGILLTKANPDRVGFELPPKAVYIEEYVKGKKKIK